MDRRVIGLFDNRAAAEGAVRELERRGFGGDALEVHGRHERVGIGGEYQPEGSPVSTHLGDGLMAGVRNLLADVGLVDARTRAPVRPEAASVYAEGVRRGGIVVAVRSTAEQSDTVMDILCSHGAADVDERTAAWLQSDWASGQTGMTAGAPAWRGAERRMIPDRRSGSRHGYAAERRSGTERRRGGMAAFPG